MAVRISNASRPRFRSLVRPTFCSFVRLHGTDPWRMGGKFPFDVRRIHCKRRFSSVGNGHRLAHRLPLVANGDRCVCSSFSRPASWLARMHPSCTFRTSFVFELHRTQGTFVIRFAHLFHRFFPFFGPWIAPRLLVHVAMRSCTIHLSTPSFASVSFAQHGDAHVASIRRKERGFVAGATRRARQRSKRTDACRRRQETRVDAFKRHEVDRA